MLRDEASEEIVLSQRHWSEAIFISKGGTHPHEIECLR